VIMQRVLDKETKSLGQKEHLHVHVVRRTGWAGFLLHHFLSLVFEMGPASGNSQTSLFVITGNGSSHSILCHSFSCGGGGPFELLTADFFHVSSIITTILS
jgi:hypothetical protein